MTIEEQEVLMFGMTKEQVIAERSSLYTEHMWAMSILSDVQEIIKSPTVDNLETARQWINKAKFWIHERAPQQSNSELEGPEGYIP